MAMYVNCPIYGNCTDDGMIVKTDKALYLVCFDCTENIPRGNCILAHSKSFRGDNT